MPIEHVTSAVEEWTRRQDVYRTYQDYYAGRHELKFATRDWQSKYAVQVLEGAVMSIRENLCPAVVTSFTDAIKVASWGTSDDQDDSLDEGLSRLLGYIKRESWKTGDAYVIVWPDATGTPRPVFQRARHMVPHVDPTNPAVLDRAAKVWVDEPSKRGRVNLYYTDRLERWETITPLVDATGSPSLMPVQANAWRPCTDGDGDVVLHTFGAAPVLWFKLDADDPTEHGASILNDVIPLQDGLNSSLAHMLVNQEAYSRPFWYLLNFKGSEAPVNPFLPENAAKPARQTFDRTKQSIVTHDGPGPFGQLDPPDLTRLLQVQDAFKSKVCGVVGIPAYVMQGEIGSVPSGAALRTLERRRADRITNWQDDATPVLRGLKQLLGMDDGPIEWEPVVTLDELERWSVAETKKALGYSFEDVITDVGETDVEGVKQRATAAATQSAATMAQAFLDGTGAAQY